jgi:glycosyltransferase involved in cell wall biosynthesis
MAELSILHVVPRWHSGGAAPSILIESESRSASGLIHRVISLERGGSTALLRRALKARLRVTLAPSIQDEVDLVERADVVVVHYWNTPSMWSFLQRWRRKAQRWILYVRVNGLHAPQRVPTQLLDSVSHVVLTSPDLRDQITRSKCDLVSAPIRLPVLPLSVARNPPRRIIHAGTLNVFKLPPTFIELHADIANATAPMQVAGAGGDEVRWQTRAIDLGIADQFEWAGFRENLIEELPEFAVFSAPTAPFTYASGDRAIQEAQVCGVPVVAFKHAPISHLIEHGETGWLVEDDADFRDHLKRTINGELEIPRERVRVAALLAHNPDRKFARLSEIYRETRSSPRTAIDPGFDTVADWVAFQTEGIDFTPGSRHPSLDQLACDRGLSAAHQAWGCEGGIAQFANAFPDANLRDVLG